ncbi:MAG: hypothetical protein ACO1PW_14035 [Actinomycetota bacterium]
MSVRTPRRRRTAAQLATTAAAVALTGGAFTLPALADPPQGHPQGQPPGHAGEAAGQPAPGNKGTVKVHEVGTPDDDRRNEPKVCEFRILGFGFPEDAQLEISIVGHGGPNAGPDSFTSTVDGGQLSTAGDWAIPGPALADGMYKLAVENTTAPGGAKQKVFKVDCPAETAPADDVLDDDTDTTPAPDGDTDGTAGGDAPDEVGGDTGSDDVIEGVDDAVVDGTTATPTAPAELAETRVLGAYLERDLPAAADATLMAAQSTQGTGIAALPRTGFGVAGLLASAGALVATGTALQRRSRTER